MKRFIVLALLTFGLAVLLTGDLQKQACAGSFCCCQTYSGQTCCNHVAFCGLYIPGCACAP